MTLPITSFYDLRQAVRALEAAGCEDNAAVRMDFDYTARDGYTIPIDEPLTSLTLERGSRQEVVLR